MSTSISKRLLSAFILPAALATAACTTEVASPGDLVEQPDEVESTLVITEGKYKPINDQIKDLETALEVFSQKSVFYGYSSDYGLLYKIQDEDFQSIQTLQDELRQTHTVILATLSNPDLNPNGRFSPTLVELAGSIGDAQKSLGSVYRYGSDNWSIEADVMEDIRRLYNEAQAVRADIAGVANPRGQQAAPATPAP